MEITVEYLEKAFDRCNQLCFQGRLPRPRLTLSKAVTRLGCLKYAMERRQGRTLLHSFNISISTAHELSAEQLDDVIIHEMIHYFIAYHGLRDNAPHGRIFQSIMESINREYHRHIRVAVHQGDRTAVGVDGQDSGAWGELAGQCKRQPPYFVMALQTLDGHYYLSSVAAASVEVLRRKAGSQKHFKQVCWLVSEDPVFGNYPRVRTLRGVEVPRQEFERVVKAAAPLQDA